MKKVNIILVEWNGYPFTRKKKLGENKITCGVGPLLEGLSRVNAGVEFNVHLVVNCSEEKTFYKFSPLKKHLRVGQEEYTELKSKYDFIKSVTFRGNEGMDIGAYNQVYNQIKHDKYDEHVLFMNSSVRQPKAGNWLLTYQELFQSGNNVGLCGISMNSHNTNLSPPEFMPHVQSFFLYTDFKFMADVFPDGFPTGEGTQDKLKLIENGEIGISTLTLKAGYSLVSSAFHDFEYKTGDQWAVPEGDLRFKAEFESIANQP